jgi:hypothetical protein
LSRLGDAWNGVVLVSIGSAFGAGLLLGVLIGRAW